MRSNSLTWKWMPFGQKTSFLLTGGDHVLRREWTQSFDIARSARWSWSATPVRADRADRGHRGHRGRSMTPRRRSLPGTLRGRYWYLVREAGMLGEQSNRWSRNPPLGQMGLGGCRSGVLSKSDDALDSERAYGSDVVRSLGGRGADEFGGFCWK